MFALPCRELEEAVLCGDTLPTADGRRLDLSVSFNASYTGLISFHLAVGPLAEFNRPNQRCLAKLNLLRDA
jgi:hypothetical protein